MKFSYRPRKSYAAEDEVRTLTDPSKKVATAAFRHSILIASYDNEIKSMEVLGNLRAKARQEKRAHLATELEGVEKCSQSVGFTSADLSSQLRRREEEKTTNKWLDLA